MYVVCIYLYRYTRTSVSHTSIFSDHRPNVFINPRTERNNRIWLWNHHQAIGGWESSWWPVLPFLEASGWQLWSCCHLVVICDSAAKEVASDLRGSKYMLDSPTSQSHWLMLPPNSLITWADQGPVRFIMGLWCLLIHNTIVFDRQPKITANKGLWEWGLHNFVGLRTKKKVCK